MGGVVSGSQRRHDCGTTEYVAAGGRGMMSRRVHAIGAR